MKRKVLVAIASIGCLAVPSCLSIDTDGLWGIGSDILCEIATGGLPGADRVDYCSVVDIDLSGLSNLASDE